jgi:adenylate cyclase class 2
MKREIEIKAKLKDINSLRTLLQSKGCTLSPSVTQIDRIYLPKGFTFATKKLTDPVLRIRTEGEKSILTFKRSQSQDLDKIEIETEIEDPNSTHEMILQLDFELTIEVQKTRQMTKYGDFTVCIDSVIGLGDFIELERIADENAVDVQTEMKKVLRELGIKESDFVLQSYDIMLMSK